MFRVIACDLFEIYPLDIGKEFRDVFLLRGSIVSLLAPDQACLFSHATKIGAPFRGSVWWFGLTDADARRANPTTPRQHPDTRATRRRIDRELGLARVEHRDNGKSPYKDKSPKRGLRSRYLRPDRSTQSVSRRDRTPGTHWPGPGRGAPPRRLARRPEPEFQRNEKGFFLLLKPSEAIGDGPGRAFSCLFDSLRKRRVWDGLTKAPLKCSNELDVRDTINLLFSPQPAEHTIPREFLRKELCQQR